MQERFRNSRFVLLGRKMKIRRAVQRTAGGIRILGNGRFGRAGSIGHDLAEQRVGRRIGRDVQLVP